MGKEDPFPPSEKKSFSPKSLCFLFKMDRSQQWKNYNFAFFCETEKLHSSIFLSPDSSIIKGRLDSCFQWRLTILALWVRRSLSFSWAYKQLTEALNNEVSCLWSLSEHDASPPQSSGRGAEKGHGGNPRFSQKISWYMDFFLFLKLIG